MKPTSNRPSRSPLLWSGIFVLTVVTTACAGRQSAADGLDAVLWIQRSAEYDALCRQTFATATERLEEARTSQGWSAAVEQSKPGSTQLPPAIIVDVDETMLDNAPYNARLIEDGARFDPETWSVWVEERVAEPVPGALEFVRQATESGVEVFYVTNRDKSLESATHDNLELHGFPVSMDRLLMRGEIDDDGSEKSNRRAQVAKTHRILMLVGDDLGDFVPSSRSASAEERDQMVERYASWFGERWFVLPNPIYGSWTKTLGDDKPAALKPAR